MSEGNTFWLILFRWFLLGENRYLLAVCEQADRVRQQLERGTVRREMRAHFFLPPRKEISESPRRSVKESPSPAHTRREKKIHTLHAVIARSSRVSPSDIPLRPHPPGEFGSADWLGAARIAGRSWLAR